MSKEVILVTGIARTGSSLVMQMLDAGGVPVGVGSYPAYEDCQPAMFSALAWEHMTGKALKYIDPYREMPPRDLAYRIILLSRNKEEQAKSTSKFLRAVAGVGTQWRKFERSIRQDQQKIDAEFSTYLHAKILRVQFEGILGDPVGVSQSIAAFLEAELDVGRMARQVVARGPKCLQGMLELQLVKRPGLVA